MKLKIEKDLLIKWNTQPGFMTYPEVLEVKKFLTEYIEYRDMWKSVMNYDPVGLSIESQLDRVAYYIKQHSQKNIVEKAPKKSISGKPGSQERREYNRIKKQEERKLKKESEKQ